MFVINFCYWVAWSVWKQIEFVCYVFKIITRLKLKFYVLKFSKNTVGSIWVLKRTTRIFWRGCSCGTVIIIACRVLVREDVIARTLCHVSIVFSPCCWELGVRVFQRLLRVVSLRWSSKSSKTSFGSFEDPSSVHVYSTCHVYKCSTSIFCFFVSFGLCDWLLRFFFER